jgi:hypothetical protein
MMKRFAVLPKWVVWLFFCVGLFAGVCIRSLTILAHYSPDAAAWVWRVAMVSYTFFFGYRYLIGIRRRRIILENKLVDAVTKSDLDDTSRAGMLYILNSITRSKELFNYAFICVISVIALVLDFIFA